MASLFRLDASIRTESSASRAIADIVEQTWRQHHGPTSVAQRHVGVEPVPATYWAAAVGAAMTPPEQWTDEQKAATTLATTLADEVLAADALLFAVPLYNFGVSQHFKSWVDLLLTEPRLAPGVESPLAGKPAVLATVRGGAYGEGTPRHGWDQATPWMRLVLGDFLQLDLEVVEREFTLAGVNPALDEFIPLGEKLREEAEANAVLHGRALALGRSAAA